MSQQEFVPEPQSHGQDALNGEDEINYPQHPYYWSVKPESQAVPKDEPPSSYADPAMQQDYYAQGYASNAQQEKNSSQGQQWSGTNGPQYSPDGDAFEQGYRPYNSYNGQYGQGVPPYTQSTNYSRTQRRNPLRLAFLVLLGLLLIKPLLIVGGLFLGGFLLFVLLPLFLLATGIFRMALGPGYRRRWYRRGPWWM